MGVWPSKNQARGFSLVIPSAWNACSSPQRQRGWLPQLVSLSPLVSARITLSVKGDVWDLLPNSTGVKAQVEQNRLLWKPDDREAKLHWTVYFCMV